MAEKVTLQVRAKDTGGNDTNFNITFLNPDATDSQLKEFGMKLNALTTNTFIGVVKTVSEDITSAVVYPYVINPASTSVTIDEDTNEGYVVLNTTIPASITATWDTTGDTNTVTFRATKSTSTEGITKYNATFTCSTAGTYTLNVAAKNGDTQITPAVAFTITRP